MDFRFSDEQQQLRDSLRNYLRRYPSPTDRSDFRDHGHGTRWKSIASDLGITALALPQDRGGLGGDPVDTMILMEEAGAALCVDPLIETIVIAGRLLASSTNPSSDDDLAQLVNGNHRYALAHFDEQGSTVTTAVRGDDGWRLDGRKSFALTAPWAERIIVSAIDGNAADSACQTLLFVVEPHAPGVTLLSYGTVDGRCASDVVFDGVRLSEDALLHSGEIASLRIEEALDAARAAQAAEAIGIMRRMLQDTIDYTQGRRQFGKALSDFQVSRHRLTDMAIHIENATSALYLGTLTLDQDPIERARAVSTMALVVARSLRFVGQNAIQLHGGMGMTDELALGHYAKRALAIEQTYGAPDWHLRRFAALRDAA